ncbi:hypothetical protein QFC19_004765 [Naganishia cerealis]|uniref:Uncharacterized protein n=1 Tax=Naganishia cerealis TaxID=610337 RepID=A0ACC2VVM2_9TREE|nr:hypothetical protein QFC19_004765 [Naganishia cerealis]
MAKKKSKKQVFVIKPWCWYCEREFEDEKGVLENTLPGRDGYDIEIFGMEGVPAKDQAEWRARKETEAGVTSRANAATSQMAKRPRIYKGVISEVDLAGLLAQHKALMSGQAKSGFPPGMMPPPMPGMPPPTFMGGMPQGMPPGMPPFMPSNGVPPFPPPGMLPNGMPPFAPPPGFMPPPPGSFPPFAGSPAMVPPPVAASTPPFPTGVPPPTTMTGLPSRPAFLPPIPSVPTGAQNPLQQAPEDLGAGLSSRKRKAAADFLD